MDLTENSTQGFRGVPLRRAVLMALLLCSALALIAVALKASSGIAPDEFLRLSGVNPLAMDHVSDTWWQHILGRSDHGASLGFAATAFFAIDTALFVPIYGYVLLSVLRHSVRISANASPSIARYPDYALGTLLALLMGIDLIENSAGLALLSGDGRRIPVLISGLGALSISAILWHRSLRAQTLVAEISGISATWARLARLLRYVLLIAALVALVMLTVGAWTPMHTSAQRAASIAHAAKGVLVLGLLASLSGQAVRWWLSRNDRVQRARAYATADRWLRLIFWLLLANALHILALVAVARVLGLQQAVDALLSMDAREPLPWSTQLLAPMLLASVLLGVSAQLVGLSLRARMAARLADAIAPDVIVRTTVIVVPAALTVGATCVTLNIAGHLTQAHGLMRAGLVFVGTVPALILALLGWWLLNTRAHRLSLAVPVLVLAVALTSAAIAASTPSTALDVGPIGVTMMASAFWGALLTTALISVPLFMNWLPASVAWLAALLFLAFRMEDPYRMPRNVPPVSGGAALSTRRYECAERALYTWLEARISPEQEEPYPIVLIAADGGGIRAGYWAARSLAILNRETGGELSRHTFAYSGVSGGSLGIATFLDSVGRHPDDPAAVMSEIDAFYARDLLSPVLGRLIITDPLRFVANAPGIRGRDEIFEEQLEQQWHEATQSHFMGQPMLEAFGTRQNVLAAPVVIFNSTIVESGKRLEIGNIGSAESESLGHRFFTYHSRLNVPSLTVAQAVHLSARFPGFSPPASIAANVCESPSGDRREGPCKWVERHWLTAVDGGYNDNSGLAPLNSMIQVLADARDHNQLRLTRGSWPACHAPENATAEELAQAAAQKARFEKLLSHVSFHVIALVASAGLERDTIRRNSDGTPTIRFQRDPFEQPELAGLPLWDLGAAYSAMDNARQGREPDSQLSMRSLMKRLPKDLRGRLNDDFLMYEMSRAITHAPVRKRKAAPVSAETVEACAGLPIERFPQLLMDIPLGWSLSPRAQQSLQCATEYAASNRLQPLRYLTRSWTRQSTRD